MERSSWNNDISYCNWYRTTGITAYTTSRFKLTTTDLQAQSVLLSGQAGLSGGFQMRAWPGLAAFPAGLAAFLGGLSLNRIFCLLRKSPKYET